MQLRGREQVKAWQEAIAAGRIEEVVRELLVKHYDPGYAASIERNFRQFPQAQQDRVARTFWLPAGDGPRPAAGKVFVLTAGTSDLPVAQEADILRSLPTS